MRRTSQELGENVRRHVCGICQDVQEKEKEKKSSAAHYKYIPSTAFLIIAEPKPSGRNKKKKKTNEI